jgi:homoserine O-acetyltransferase
VSEREDFEMQQRARPECDAKRVEQRGDDAGHSWRLFKTTRNINGCNAYSVSDTRKQRNVIEFLRCAIRSIMTGSATRFHKDNPTAGKADSAVEAMAKAALPGDANDRIYQYEASTDDNPSPMLEKIQAPLFAINSADDEINPPELGILEREIRRVRRGRYILIPLADQTSDLQPCGLWKNHLLGLLHISEPRN